MPMMMKPVLSLICNALVMWVVCVTPNVMPCLSCRLSVASRGAGGGYADK